LKRYQELIKEGDRFLSVKVPDYQKAMNSYSAAMTACKDKMPEVQKKIIVLFNNINDLKKSADAARLQAETERQNTLREQLRADSALKIANNIIDKLYFYEGKYALAGIRDILTYDYPSSGSSVVETFTPVRYGYINKMGKEVIQFKYDDASPFDFNNGFARVKLNGMSFLIDTTGAKEFLLSEDTNLIWKNTEAVDLRKRNLQKFPEQLINRPNLKIIFLSDNLLEKIPKEISTLSDHLIFLDLSHNNINSLPTELWDLDSLQCLQLSFNEIPSIPESIRGLQNLKNLDVSYNRLTFLPAELFNLNNLSRLSVRSNKITVLQEGLAKLKELKSLDLSNNPLKSLPAEIGNLQKLKALYLDGNNFPEAEKQRIQKLLPGCRIHWEKTEDE
ncbi:MAG: leucine-rich repeat domain-containing protein, partial [Mariniphaga sp.]